MAARRDSQDYSADSAERITSDVFISIADLFIEGTIIRSSLLSTLENAGYRWSQSRSHWVKS